MANDEIVIQIILVIVGAFSTLAALYVFIKMFRKKEDLIVNLFLFSFLGLLSIGLFMGGMPILKSLLSEEYVVLKGDCVIVEGTGRHGGYNIKMIDSDVEFSFASEMDFAMGRMSKIEEYGLNTNFYCEVTTTKEHDVKISYKLFDPNTRELLVSDE